jgi:basic membrane lipoprotein Med (substrate-binding protein (PBP1-ABC) superfamily)
MNKEHHKVQLINLGNSRSFFSDSFNAGDGRLLAQELLQRGADAIFPVVGPQAPDVAREIKSRGSSAIIVGVDVPQENDNTVNFKSVYTDKRKNDMTVKFSAVKNIANVTSKILSLSYAGDTGIEYDVGAYGYLTVGDASNNGMGVSSAALPYLYDFVNGVYHDSSDPS